MIRSQLARRVVNSNWLLQLVDITPACTAPVANADMESTPVNAKDHKEAREMRQNKRQIETQYRKMKENSTKDDGEKKPAGKNSPAVDSSEDFTPSHTTAVAGASADMETTPVNDD